VTPVVWTTSALADLEAIHAYVAHDSTRYADVLVDGIISAVGRITRFPRSGRIVPEFGDEAIREILHGTYRIVYRLQAERAEILTVFHGARRGLANGS
jgi:plasmid stabilization system protein ParE